jgi:alpha-L-arabinofuranosidase
LAVPQRGAAQTSSAITLNVHLSQRGARISPTLYGAFFEEINHAGEGGIYGELVRNRAFNERTIDPKDSGCKTRLLDPTDPVGWSSVISASATGSITLDASQPLNSALPRSLKLQIISASRGQRVGAANGGYWGIALDPGASYNVSFYAKTVDSPGALTVSLESTSGAVLAQTTLIGLTTSWQKFTSSLTVSGLSSRTSNNQLVVAVHSPGTVWLNVVSLFPQTWHGRPNGLRSDIMNVLSGMKPKLMRFPGGDYIEGCDLTQRWNWKQTIGNIEQRPGHETTWGYFSSDGLGLHEYLQMSEDLGAAPILALFAGNSKGHVVDPSQLRQYVQDALDAIQYAIGATNTAWGAKRAANGHRAPFSLSYVEVGNEDPPDSYKSYVFPMFYDAIKAQYPSIQVIATADVSVPKPDVVDEHFYPDTPSLIGLSRRYDSYNRSGPKIFVGEYAARGGTNPGFAANLGGAVAEAAFMTGMERNADIVMGSAYAPLFVNEDAARFYDTWNPDLIAFNAQGVYGSPNYYVQQLFSTHTGDVVIPTDTGNGDDTLFTAASLVESNNTVYLKVVNSGSTAKTTLIGLRGLTSIDTSATVDVITSGNITDQNSSGQPTHVAPTTSTITGVGSTFTYTFAANSVTVFTLTNVELWVHGVPGAASDVPVAPGTSPTSWYTTPENVQHIAYVGTDQRIHELFFILGPNGQWMHGVPGAASDVPVAPGTSPTSWYTTPENVQHIAYVGTDQRIHELFYFIR